MFRHWSVLGLLLSATGASAATVGFAGDSFSTEPAYIAALEEGTGHTFRQITRFDQAQLEGLDVVWLDGFSAFTFTELDLGSAELDAFIRAGKQLIVQSPGFGGEPIEAYPFGTGLTVNLAPDNNTVRLINQWMNLNRVTNEQLSGWGHEDVPGYFTIDGTGWMGLADTGVTGQWVSIGQAHDAGNVIYTFQDMSRMVFNPREDDAYALLDALIVPEPSSFALLGLGGAFALLRRRKS